MSIWEFNLPIKEHNLIGPQYWKFSQEVLLICPVGRGRGYERMLLDSLIMCIAYLTSVIGSFTISIAYVWLQWEGLDG
jgi:hypothetical protein